MKYFKIILFLLLFIECKDNHSRKMFFNKDFLNIIDSYIEKNPIKKLVLKDDSLNSTFFSYPSYHIYFNKKNKDTIVSIIQYPSLHEFEPMDFYNNPKDSLGTNSISPDGYIKYKEKYPLIFFKINNYYNKENLSKYLVKEIPDSLKYNGLNIHIKFVRWDYKIKNKKFIRIR